MIHAYNEIYLGSVMRNIAGVFDIAVNAEMMDADTFANNFAGSDIAKEIEAAAPDYLAGKSSTEILSELLGRRCNYTNIPMNRSPEYWAGWVLAYTQWFLNKPFQRILSAISFSQIVSLYHPYHEADEQKTAELIKELISSECP